MDQNLSVYLLALAARYLPCARVLLLVCKDFRTAIARADPRLHSQLIHFIGMKNILVGLADNSWLRSRDTVFADRHGGRKLKSVTSYKRNCDGTITTYSETTDPWGYQRYKIVYMRWSQNKVIVHAAF